MKFEEGQTKFQSLKGITALEVLPVLHLLLVQTEAILVLNSSTQG